MRALVVGGDGFVGSHLTEMLRAGAHDVIATSRRGGTGDLKLDLGREIPAIPPCDAVFLVAAITTFQACEGNASAWRINVDAPIAIAAQVKAHGGFPVFVSSDCVEWCGGTAYARQKAHAELAISLMGGAVVRPTRIKPERLGNLCAVMIDVALNRKGGVHRWQ